MANVAQLIPQLLALTESERSEIATELLSSLPPSSLIDQDDDGGVAEALRREAEMEADPSMVMSAEEFHAAFRGPGVS